MHDWSSITITKSAWNWLILENHGIGQKKLEFYLTIEIVIMD